MPNTYSQLYIQLVFAVKYREALIEESFREDLQKYMAGIITNRKCKLYAIYANPDHVHILLSIKPNTLISDLVRDIKSISSSYINERKLTNRFHWQDGYGAFSYAHSQVNSVVRYILNQPIHHKSKSFRKEYITFLQKFRVEYDERFLFDFIDNRKD